MVSPLTDVAPAVVFFTEAIESNRKTIHASKVAGSIRSSDSARAAVGSRVCSGVGQKRQKFAS